MTKDFEILNKVSVANDVCFLTEALEELYDKYWHATYEISEMRWDLDMCLEFIRHHMDGHLPPILGAEKLEKALEVLKIRDDYEVRKPVIYASARPGANSGLRIKLTDERR